MSESINIGNIDLLIVGVAVAAIGLLGFVTYFNNRKSSTNRYFLIFSILTMCWGISNYFEYRFNTSELILWALRIHLFISTWYSLFIFQLSYTFPSEKIIFPWWYKKVVIPLVVVTSILTLTDFVFSGISFVAPAGQVTNPDRGPGIALFVGVVFGLLLASIAILAKKTRTAESLARRQSAFILAGMSLMLVSFLTFNIVLPVIFNNLKFIPYAAIFVLPFVSCTAYAVYRHNLFNIRAAAVAALTFVLCISMFIEVIFSGNITTLILRSSIFLLVLLASILMNKFVETIAEQREALQVANEGQSNLIHIMNHQIKGYLSKSKGIFAELLTGDYGAVTVENKPLLEEGLNSLTDGVQFVQGVLNSSSAESGTLSYNMIQTDFKAIVAEVAEKQRDMATDKKLSLEVELPDGEVKLVGDPIQLREVVRNLIDNSIHYTLEGGLKVKLETKPGKALMTIKDTGVGISAEDMGKLFTKGGRGKDSLKINVNSTGYGLSFVKAVVDAHKGKVWAESEGSGKGSTFFVELPLA